MGFLGPFRNILFFLLELFVGSGRRRMRRNAKTWKLVVFVLLLISISANLLLFRSVIEKLEENNDLKRRNYVVMNNNNELMKLIDSIRKVNDDFKEINSTLKHHSNMSMQTNSQLLELLRTKDIPIEKIEEIEKTLKQSMIAQANIEIDTNNVNVEEAALEKKIDSKTSTMIKN